MSTMFLRICHVTLKKGPKLAHQRLGPSELSITVVESTMGKSPFPPLQNLFQHKPILNIQDPCKLPGARLVDHSFVQCPVVPKPQVLKPYIRSYYVHESLEFGRARVVTKILQKGLHPCRSIANPTIKTPLTVEYVRYLKCLQQVGTKALTTETGNKCHKIGPVL